MKWWSFRELDEAAGLSKGSAFRCFKALEPHLQEGEDFQLLRQGQDDEAITRLRSEGRIYASSVHVVLLSEATALRILQALRDHKGSQ